MTLKKFFPLSVSLFILCLCSIRCGYSVRSLLPANLKTVHVEPFKNSIIFTEEQSHDIYFPLLEVEVRKAIVDRYLFDGNLKIADADKADLTLEGELKSYERQSLRISENEDTQEYRIHVIVSLTLKDNKKGKVLWEEPGFAGETTYFVTGPNAKTETAAVNDAVKDLARRVVERTIEDW